MSGIQEWKQSTYEIPAAEVKELRYEAITKGLRKLQDKFGFLDMKNLTILGNEKMSLDFYYVAVKISKMQFINKVFYFECVQKEVENQSTSIIIPRKKIDKAEGLWPVVIIETLIEMQKKNDKFLDCYMLSIKEKLPDYNVLISYRE